MNNTDQEPTLLIIFGITGDLSQRYLMPALYNLTEKGSFHPNTRILGITRGDTSTAELYQKAKISIQSANDACAEDTLEAMRGRTQMFKMDLDDPDGYARLLKKLDELENAAGECMNRLYWLSIPPKAYPPVIQLLGEQGHNTSCAHGKAATRLLVEKPFGFDLQSAEALLAETGEHFSEEQTFRIDHYMAKQTVRDILNSRFNDRDREAHWNKDNIASIEISAKEKIGIEGRATFYESLGALRDFIQSHLMQILGIVTMDIAESLSSDNVHRNKETVLSQVLPVPADSVPRHVLRGQYEGYRQEVDNPDSTTETYVSVSVGVNNSRWKGVPITMLTGKALDERKAQVKAIYKDGSEFTFLIQGGNGNNANAYEKVFIDAIQGDHTLFATKNEILSSWQVLQPILDYWAKTDEDLVTYPQGSSGPKRNTA